VSGPDAASDTKTNLRDILDAFAGPNALCVSSEHVCDACGKSMAHEPTPANESCGFVTRYVEACSPECATVIDGRLGPEGEALEARLRETTAALEDARQSNGRLQVRVEILERELRLAGRPVP
jgi:hypothetical protein